MTIHRNEDSDHDRNSDDDIYINVYLECVDNDEFLNNIYTRFTISIRNFDSYENPKIRGLKLNNFIIIIIIII